MKYFKKDLDYKEIANVTFDNAIKYSKILENSLYDLNLEKYLTKSKNRIEYQIVLFLIVFCEFKIIENFGIQRTQECDDFSEGYNNELKEIISKHFETPIEVVGMNLYDANKKYIKSIENGYNPWGECSADQLDAVGSSIEFTIMKPTLKTVVISLFNSDYNRKSMMFRQKVSECVFKIYNETQKSLYEER